MANFYASYPGGSGGGGGGGMGTVTSVGLADGSTTPIYTVTGSPVTTAGTLTITLDNQNANTVFAGPAAGGPAEPTFRALVPADLPVGTGSVTSVSVVTANGFAGTVATATTTPAITLSTTIVGILKGDGTAISAAIPGTDYQPAGNYITDLTGDVTASGPGSVPATLADIPNKRYIDFLNGSDAGTGTLIQPWKTLQFAYNSVTPSINEPYVFYISGGNNDSDGAPITGKPNVSLISDYPIQVSQPLTISGGATNDSVTFTNIIFTGAVDWQRNDASILQMVINKTQFFSGPVFKQSGSGSASILANDSVTVDMDLLTGGTGSFFTGHKFIGSTTFEDANTSAYYQIMGGYIGGAMSIAGGAFGYFSGVQFDTPFGATLTTSTTANGTPTIQSDDASIPASIIGPNTLILQSFAQHESYSPAVPADYSPAVAQVAEALDQLASRVPVSGAGTVTSVSVTTANGVSGVVATPTTTPAITLTLGAITPTSVAASGTVSGSNLSGTNTGDITVTAFGAAPSASGFSLTGQALTLEPFDSTHPGAVTASGGGAANFLRADGTWAVPPGTATGTVTSVALTVPGFLSVAGSPVTTSGTLAVTLATQTANTVFAGPTSGGAATPTFRSLVVSDMTIANQAIAATTIDWSTGNGFSKTLGANTTFTFSNQLSGQTLIVRLTNTASNFTVTWPTVAWAGGTPPVMSPGAVSDVYTFYFDGTSTYGSYVQAMS